MTVLGELLDAQERLKPLEETTVLGNLLTEAETSSSGFFNEFYKGVKRMGLKAPAAFAVAAARAAPLHPYLTPYVYQPITTREELEERIEIKKAGEKVAQEFADKMWELSENPKIAADTRTIRGRLGAILGEVLPYTGASIAAGAITGPVGPFIVAYSIEGQSSYQEAKKRGATEEQARLEGDVVGLINGTIEAIQIGRILKFAKGGSLHTLVQSTKKFSLKEMARESVAISGQLVKLGIENAVEEMLQEGTAIVTPAITRGDYPKKPDGSPDIWAIGSRIGEAGVSGAIAGVFYGGAGGLVSEIGAKAPEVTPQEQVIEKLATVKTEPSAIPSEITPTKPVEARTLAKPTVIPEAGIMPAIQLKDGTVVTGINHGEVYHKLVQEGKIDFKKSFESQGDDGWLVNGKYYSSNDIIKTLGAEKYQQLPITEVVKEYESIKQPVPPAKPPVTEPETGVTIWKQRKIELVQLAQQSKNPQEFIGKISDQIFRRRLGELQKSIGDAEDVGTGGRAEFEIYTAIESEQVMAKLVKEYGSIENFYNQVKQPVIPTGIEAPAKPEGLVSTKQQRQQLAILSRERGMSETERRDWLEKKFNVRSFTKLTETQAQSLIDELRAKPQIFTPEEAKTLKAKESLTDYALVNQAQMKWKTPLPENPELRQDTIKNMRVLGNKQAKHQEHIITQEELNLEAKNALNPLSSMRYAVMSVEEKTGIPIYNRVQNAIYKSGEAKLIPEDVISKTIKSAKGDFSALRLSVKDNRDMGNYLFSPESREKTLKEISPQALQAVQSLEKLLQKPGPIANEAQLTRFILWDEYGVKPPDVAKYGDPKAILKEYRNAKKAGTEREWITAQPPIGLRDFYYLSDNAHAGIMDAILQRMSRPALTLQEGVKAPPANLPSEAFTREGSAKVRKGSVINNVIKHWERLAIFNAVHDDMRAFYDSLNKAKPSARDRRYFDMLWSNILQKGRPLDFPLDKLQIARTAMWRMWLSPIGNTPTMIRMTLRNTLDVLHGLPIMNIKEVPSAIGRIRTDPEFKEDFVKDWMGRVNQGRKKYKEFLLLDEGSISRDMPNSEALRKAGYYLDKTTVLYGMTDSFTRAPVYALEYEIVKNNAQRFIKGEIDLKKFWSNTNLDLMKIPQQEIIKHYLDEGNARMAAREAAVWATENSNFRYETTMRSLAEQTQIGRTLMGLYTYPKGVMELAYQQGIKPMVLGIQTNRPGMAWRGAKEFTKLMAVTALKGVILKETLGMTEDILSSVFYTILSPELSMTYTFTKDFSGLWYQYRQGRMTLPQFLDKVGNLISYTTNPVLPLGIPMILNALESVAGTKDLTAYKAIKQLLGEDVKLRKVYRTDYQKIIHALTGAYETPEKKEQPVLYERVQR